MKTKFAAKFAAGIAAGAVSLACLLPSARACEIRILWQADLSSSPTAPGLPASSAVASLEFDPDTPGASVEIKTRNLPDVSAIDLHIARSYADHTGPTVVHLYAAKDGPLPATFVRRIAPADLLPATTPKVTTFADVVQAVVSHRAYVTVSSSAAPLSGFVSMHKEEIYSDSATDATHNPALHAHRKASS